MDKKDKSEQKMDKKFTKIRQKRTKVQRKLKMDKSGQKIDKWTKSGQKSFGTQLGIELYQLSGIYNFSAKFREINPNPNPESWYNSVPK